MRDFIGGVLFWGVITVLYVFPLLAARQSYHLERGCISFGAVIAFFLSLFVGYWLIGASAWAGWDMWIVLAGVLAITSYLGIFCTVLKNRFFETRRFWAGGLFASWCCYTIGMALPLFAHS